MTMKDELQASRDAHHYTIARCDALERKLLDIRKALREQGYVAGCGEAGQLWADVDAVLQRPDLAGRF